MVSMFRPTFVLMSKWTFRSSPKVAFTGRALTDLFRNFVNVY